MFFMLPRYPRLQSLPIKYSLCNPDRTPLSAGKYAHFHKVLVHLCNPRTRDRYQPVSPCNNSLLGRVLVHLCNHGWGWTRSAPATLTVPLALLFSVTGGVLRMGLTVMAPVIGMMFLPPLLRSSLVGPVVRILPQLLSLPTSAPLSLAFWLRAEALIGNITSWGK